MIAGHGRRRRLLLQAAIAGVVCAVGVIGLEPPVAVADSAPANGTPATVTADALPTWQINGVVWAQVVVGNTVYVGGNFSTARPPGVARGGPGEVAANNVFAYDITTGNRVTSFSHQLNGEAKSIAASPDGSRIYIGGDFTTADGQARSHIVAFNTVTNGLDPTFKPAVSSRVATIVATNSSVYIGGYFNSVGGVVRKYLAAFNRLTGALLPWAPVAAGGTPWSMVLAPSGSALIIGGSFTSLDKTAAYGMGSVSASSGAALPWAANQKIRDSGKSGAITSLATDGTQIYGSGYAYGRGSSFEGTFAANPTTGAINWVNDCHGDTYSVFPIGQVLYTAGHAHNCRWIGDFPNTTPSWTFHRALAFTTYPTGTNTGPDDYGWNYSGLPDSNLLQWFPTLSAGTFTKQDQAAWSVSGNRDYVVLAGEFPAVNDVAQEGLVRFAVPSLAPNKMGPMSSPGLTPTVASPLSTGNFGSVFVTWNSTWDKDNSGQIYTVLRDGVAIAGSEQTVASNFWSRPRLSFTDSDVAVGSSHRYQVRVQDPFGNTLNSGTSVLVRVGQPPKAVIGPPACSNLACSFDGSSSTDDFGTISSYTWDFGDGTATANTVVPTHSYAATGTYQLRLTVDDGAGGIDTTTQSITVLAPPPTAMIKDVSCVYRLCTFDGSATSNPGGVISSYVWDFGAGPTATGVVAVHEYALSGNYSLKLTVTNSNGETDVYATTKSVEATVTRTTLVVSPHGSLVVGSTVRLSATVSPAVAGSVAFSDGTTRLGTVAVANGVAMLSTTKLSVARHQLCAVFTPTPTPSGTRASYASSSFVVSRTVIKAPATVSVRMTADRVRLGTVVRMAVDVWLHGTMAKATGTVFVMIGSRDVATGALRAGSVTVTLPRFVVGKYRLVVSYLGIPTAASGSSTGNILTVTER